MIQTRNTCVRTRPNNARPALAAIGRAIGASSLAPALARGLVVLIAMLALPSLAAAQNTAVTLTPAGNPAPPWAWFGGTANPLVLTGASNIPEAVTGIAQVNITMTHSSVGDGLIRLEFTPSTGPGAGTPIGVDILNQFGQTISFGSVGYPSNLGGSYTFIDAPAGQSTLANGNTNYTAAPGPYRAYGKFSVPTTLSTSLAGVVGTGTWRLTFSNPGSGGSGGLGPAPSVSAASVTFTSGGCPGAWSALGSGASGGFATAVLPGGDVMVGDVGRYNPTTNAWTPLTNRTNGSVVALAVTPSGDVIVGGTFTTAGGVAANNIARYNPITGVWTALATGVSGGTVYALVALPGGDVIAGGNFTSAGGVAVNKVARYNPTTNTWAAMGSGLIGSSSLGGPTAYAMALLPSGLVIIAGDFFSGNGIAAGGFTRYNPTTGVWTSTAGPGIATYVGALTVLPGGDVIAGGTAPVFPPAGGSYLLGRYNPTTNVWTGLGAYTSGIVSSLATLPSGDVMVGGSFTTAGGVPVNAIGRCNPNTDSWTGLGSGVSRVSTPSVGALVALPSGDVIAAGSFTSAGGVAVNSIARYTFGSPAPSLGAQPSSQSVCDGESATFSVTPSGSGSFTYQWQIQTSPAPNETWLTLTTGPVPLPCGASSYATATPANASTVSIFVRDTCPTAPGTPAVWPIRCIVTSACGSATSNTATLTILGGRCNPADIAYDSGDPLPPTGSCDPNASNNGVTEADYNLFFATFFDAGPACDIANDDGSPLPPFGIVDTNNGVTEGDYNLFFAIYFDGCSL